MPSQTIKLAANAFTNLLPLLEADKSYVVQATSGQIRLKEIEVLPDDRTDRGGHVIELGKSWYITVGEVPIWVWSIGVPATIEVSDDE